MSDKPRCSEEMWRGFRSSRCTRAATVQRDGRGYCAQHDPERVKARWEAAQRRAEEKAAEERARRVRWGLRDATVEELRAELARREGGSDE